jgi:hypothetical protein
MVGIDRRTERVPGADVVGFSVDLGSMVHTL